MAIHVQQSLSGFIASTPQLSFTDRGDARFYAKVGREHYRRNDDLTFTKLQTTFHDLVQYGRAAERAYAQFKQGDKFVAEGYVREYNYELDGQPHQSEQFVAKKLGHDTARTRYTIDRTQATTGHAGETIDERINPRTDQPDRDVSIGSTRHPDPPRDQAVRTPTSSPTGSTPIHEATAQYDQRITL